MRRIVVIDNHIIAQFHDNVRWWTMSKASNNDEGDFALWPLSEANINKARKLAGEDAPLIKTDLKPNERYPNCWFISSEDQNTKPYTQALRELARTL